MRADPKKRRKKRLTSKELGKGRGDFDRDYTSILYSHAFRRLRHKTQVFFYAQNDHLCTRLDHSLCVAAISEIVCNNLKSNGADCDPVLAKTIGIGHDLGHPPFGHAGEDVLNGIAGDIGGFRHERHSLRIVDQIEKPPAPGQPMIGLNLTLAVRDGIVNHCGEDRSTIIKPARSPDLESGKSFPFTLEGCVVRLVDKIAYLGRDFEDAVITGMIKQEEIPAQLGALVGTKNGEIVDYFVGDLIAHSHGGEIALSEEASALMSHLMEFNYTEIYEHKTLASYKKRVKDILETLFDRFMAVLKEYHDRVKKYFDDDLEVVTVFGDFVRNRRVLYFDKEAKRLNDDNLLRKTIVIDFLSTLTDSFVFEACKEYFLPKSLDSLSARRQTAQRRR